MSDAIIRLNAALEGRYAIERELGEGGMATVYLADDQRHGRKVALKVLKPELAAVVGAERFLSEIKVTANLQHPHILPLFDSGEADGFLFYVMPYVEGESLRDRIDREKQLPVDEAVRIATAVANALDHAHRHKVIHRDIKPANILLQDGEPVVADFGIALAVGAAGSNRLTETGLSLGTPYYMSPEQATGDQAVGASTDTYALGSVLYEMLTGDPPYMGSTAQAVLGQIISSKAISATEKRASIPANVDAALRKALEKLPADRFASAQDFVRALGDEHFRYGESVAGAGVASTGLWNWLTMATTALATLSTLMLGWSFLRPEPPDPVTRVSVLMGEDQFLTGRGTLDLSTDGSLMVYQGQGDEGEAQLWVRRWDDLEATPIRNTDGARNPAISPDGREVAFDPGGSSIRVVPLEGGVSRTLTDSAFCCPSWSPEGDWVYYSNPSRGLSRVPASGGPSEVVTQVDSSPGAFRITHADVLPSGMGVLYMAGGADRTNQRIQALDLETGEVKDLIPGQTPRYSPTGHLLFVDANEGTLLAAPFDAKNLELTGAVLPVAEGVLQDAFGNQFFDISASGRLVYRTGSREDLVTPVWVERDGTFREIDPGWTLPFDAFSSSLALSPDDTRLAVSARGPEGTVDVYVKELDAGPLTRLTFEGTLNRWSTWSPDGRSVTFVSNRAGQDDLWSRRADGSGRAELVLDLDEPIKEALYSPDGEWLLVVLGEGNYGGSIYGIRLGVDSVPTPLVVSKDWFAVEMSLSSDGRWLAYASNMLGDSPIDDDALRIWVQPFPDVDAGRWQVSTIRSDEPIWAHSGRELFYNGGPAYAQDFMVAEVSLEPTLAVGQQRVLFSGVSYLRGVGYRQPVGHEQKVSLDDQRFVMFRDVEVEADNQLILVDNFFEELKERVGN